jgi:hypothetical protein
MPICQSCAATYDDALAACPKCGQANPIAQPAPILCPFCQNADQHFKISEIGTRPDLQTSDLLEKLSFPSKPVAPEINAPLTILGVLLMFASLFGLIRVHTGSGPLIFAVCMVFAVVCLLKARVNSKQAAAYLEVAKKWRAAKARWESLYYCPACQQVFLPGERAANPAERRAEYLAEAQ